MVANSSRCEKYGAVLSTCPESICLVPLGHVAYDECWRGRPLGGDGADEKETLSVLYPQTEYVNVSCSAPGVGKATMCGAPMCWLPPVSRHTHEPALSASRLRYALGLAVRADTQTCLSTGARTGAKWPLATIDSWPGSQ